MLATEPNPKSILLAEDDDDDYLIFTLAVQETRIAVAMTRVTNGDQLMGQLENGLPDILFLDLEMPCKSGKECMKEIRANHKYDELPIIVYSSFTDASSIDFCFREGANFYTIKPTSIAELTEILKRILVIDWKNLSYFPPRSGFVLNQIGNN